MQNELPETTAGGMNLFQRLRVWRAARKEDERAIATAQQELARAGDEPTRSQEETVEDVAGSFPSAP
jgi:hypothetical protein